MATARVQTIDDLARCEMLTSCLVCLDSYVKPNQLRCGHTFCRQCLRQHNATYYDLGHKEERHVMNNGSASSSDDVSHTDVTIGLLNGNDSKDTQSTSHVICPTCREETDVPVSSQTDEHPAALSRTNSAKPKTRRISVATTHAPVTSCDACESRSVREEAEYYCGKCGMDMCGACRQVHDQHELFKSHNVIHIGNRDSMNLQCSRPNHNKGPCLYFCATCDSPVCCICIITGHDSHSVSKLSDVINLRRENMKTLLNTVGPRIEKLSGRVRKLLHHHSALPVESCSRPTLRQNSTPSGTPTLERACMALSLMKASASANDDTLSEISDITEEVEKLQRLYNLCMRVLELSQSRKLLVVYDELMKRLDSVCLIECHELSTNRLPQLEHASDVTDASVSVTADTSFSHGVNSTTSSHSIHDHHHHHLPQRSSNHSVSSRSTQRHSSVSQDDVLFDDGDHFMLFKPKLVWKLERTRQDPGELWNPSGVAFRPGGGIVVAEYDIMNDKNNRLRLFDADGNMERAVAHGTIKPLGVACNRDGNFAVTDCSGKRVKILAPDGHVLLELGKGQFGWPYGVACNSKGQYIISDPFHDTVHIYNHDGRRIKVFGASGSQNTQFKNPLHLNCDSRDNIVISDSGNNCVKVFDAQGHFMHMSSDSPRTRVSDVSRHKHKGMKTSRLKGPRGVAVDLKDNIVVADDCGRVCLLDKVGKYVRNLLTEEDTVKFPEALASSRAGLLAVTEWNPNNMFAVKVFNMYE